MKKESLENLNNNKWMKGMFDDLDDYRIWTWIKKNKRFLVELISLIVMIILVIVIFTK